MKLKKALSALVTLVALAGCMSNPNTNLEEGQLSPEQLSSFSAGNDKQVIEIKLKDVKKDLTDLSTKSFDLFGFNKNKKTVRARVTKQQADYVKTKGLETKEFFENAMDKGGLPTGYMTADQMTAKMKDLATKFPNIVSMSEIGKTWEKRSIYALTITNKQGKKDGKFESLFIGGMHARELAPPEIMYKLAEALTSGYGKDASMTDLVNNRVIHIVPMVNVDGRVQVEKGNSWQRKNTHGAGVDLNRNFDSYWNYKGLNVPSSWVGDATNQNSETYSGTGPASEPEVQAIQNFYNGRKLNMVLDMHAYGEMGFYPVGYSDKDVPEVSVFKDLYSHTNFKDLGYQIGTSMSLLYPTTATTDDYAYVKHKAFGLGMEVGQSFRPSFSEVETMWNNLKPGLLSLLKNNNRSLAGK
ncbi:MAG: M14 family zinc carboxypeptidase [Candidatus Sericytochromatia bacterium]